MGFEAGVSGSVSSSLAIVIQSEINNVDGVQPPTLGSILNAMDAGLVVQLIEAERLDAEEKESIFSEIKTLIEMYGDDALAQRFITYRASDTLAIVIEAAASRRENDNPPTLRSIRELMNQGLVAELVATGDIDPDEDETLLSEIESLINLHGEDVPAENFLP